MATESGLGYTLVPPKSYTGGRKSGQPTVIVIHTTEGSAHGQSAEDGAAYDQRRTDGTSAHFFVDSNSVVQCVRTTDEAHTARAHGNDVGIQIEVCGKAGWSAATWSNDYGRAALEQLARLCVKLRAKYPGRFPLRRLTPQQLRAGENGFAGHVDCTYAWPEDNGTHTDPGTNFPWSTLFARITDLEDPVTEAEFKSWMTEWASSSAGKQAIALAVLTFDPGKDANGNVKPGGIENVGSTAAENPTVGPNYALRQATVAAQVGYQIRDRVDAVLAAVQAGSAVDVQALGAAIAANLPPIEGGGPTPEDIQSALREVFADAGQK